MISVCTKVDFIGEVGRANTEQDRGYADGGLVNVLALDPLHEGGVIDLVNQEGAILRGTDDSSVFDVDS